MATSSENSSIGCDASTPVERHTACGKRSADMEIVAMDQTKYLPTKLVIMVRIQFAIIERQLTQVIGVPCLRYDRLHSHVGSDDVSGWSVCRILSPSGRTANSMDIGSLLPDFYIVPTTLRTTF